MSETTSVDQKLSHLILIANESGFGHDVIEDSSVDGGILLNEDEDDIIELSVLIEETVVPLFYQGNWPLFVKDLLCAIKNAKEDGTGDPIDDVRYFLQAIVEEGKVLVA